MKNKKISESLKRYHAKKKKLKQQRKDIFTILWIMAFFLSLTAIHETQAFSYELIEEPTMISWGFPESGEREMTVIEKRQVNANKIRYIAKQRNFPWPDYAVKVACCESWLGWHPNGTEVKINNKGNYPPNSKDRGMYMFNDYWQAQVSDECANDLNCSTNLFMDRVEQGDQHLWACDKIVRGVKDYSLNKCKVK